MAERPSVHPLQDGLVPSRRLAETPIDTGPPASIVLDAQELHVYYGAFRAVRNVNLAIPCNRITAMIGPSGCGKSTVLRCFNRMNDLIETARVTGSIQYHRVNLYATQVDPVEVRRRIGMVFQKPNPLPKSIYDNVAFGPKLMGHRAAPTSTASSNRPFARRPSGMR